jgi:hypothetical protein
VSAFYSRPGRYDTDPDRDRRVRAGLANVRAVLADVEARRTNSNDEPLTERERTMLACRQRARHDRRERERQQRFNGGNTAEPTQIGSMLRRVGSRG